MAAPSVRRVVQLLAAAVLVWALVSVATAPVKAPNQQPFPDGPEYADATQRLANGQGFVTFVHGPIAQAPRYPPGLPLLLEPFAAVGSDPGGVEVGGQAIAMLYVGVMVLAAWCLGGATAALLTGLVVLVSPFARESAAYTLSDCLVAVLLVSLLPILSRMTRAGERLAGALTGFAILTRLTGAIGLLATLGAVDLRRGRRILLWAVPSVIGLLALQWVMYGDPFTTGYDYWNVGFRQTFSFANLFGAHTAREGNAVYTSLIPGGVIPGLCPCAPATAFSTLPNFWFNPLLLAGAFWVFSPPLLPLVGLWWAWRHRREPVGRYALLVVIGHVIVFDFYLFQAARFLAGPASVLVVLGAVGLTAPLEAVASRSYGLVRRT